MSNRWKFQLIFGGIWALVVSVILVLIDLRERSLEDQLNGPGFYIRTGLTFILGIFVFAYIVYKQNLRRIQRSEGINEQSPRQ